MYKFIQQIAKQISRSVMSLKKLERKDITDTGGSIPSKSAIIAFIGQWSTTWFIPEHNKKISFKLPAFLICMNLQCL